MLLCAYGFNKATYQLTTKKINQLEFSESQKLLPFANKVYENDLDFKNEIKAALGNNTYNKNDGAILEKATKINANLILIGILGFIACFAFSLGPVMWVLLSELYPLKYRGLAIGVIAFINSLISSLVQLIFPWELSNLGNDGMRYYDEQMAEAAENAADVGSLEEIDGIGDFAKYSAFVVGNVIPSLIGGGGAGAVGGYAAKRLAMHQAGKALVKQSAGQLSKKQAATQYARSTVGQEALAKRGLRGQMGGAMLFGTAAGAGESFTRIFDETGEEAAVEAIITGIAAGALDAMAPMRALQRILPQKTFRDATEEVAGNIAKNRSVYRRALSEAGKTGATEHSFHFSISFFNDRNAIKLPAIVINTIPKIWVKFTCCPIKTQAKNGPNIRAEYSKTAT